MHPKSRRPGLQSPSVHSSIFQASRVWASRPCVQNLVFSVRHLKIIFKTATEMNCIDFVEAAIIEPIITLIFIALLYIINVCKFLFPRTLVSSVLKNSSWHKRQSFCGSNHLWAFNHVDAFETTFETFQSLAFFQQSILLSKSQRSK